MSYLDELNDAQRAAVTKTRGPVLVVAGAGAGKTKTLVYRILHLIKEEGVAPHSILAVTFTNKAAQEMRSRLATLLAKEAPESLPYTREAEPFIGTFHGLAVSLLRANAAEANVPRNFAIFDRSDARQALRDALKQAGYNPKEFDPAKIQAAISRHKGEGMSQAYFAETGAADYYDQVVSDVWRAYDDILTREKALDFDDLLLKTVLMLRAHGSVRMFYHNRWRYIHIDEYQDTNTVQYELAELLAAGHRNIYAVGDEDQLIYEWRGAHVKHILSFEHDYPEADIVFLEENYRSTRSILAAAHAVIRKNILRKDKKLFTNNAEGEKIAFFVGYDPAAEAHFVASEAGRLVSEGVSPREIAVLYRANFQSRALEEAFLMSGIPYQVVGTRFFERKEVKDMLAYARAALSPNATDIRRIANVPPRGIGKATLLKLFAEQERAMTPAIRERVVAFYTLLEGIKKIVEKNKPSDALKLILAKTGIEGLYRRGTEEDRERLENLKELVSLATKYDLLDPLEGMEKLLEDALLASDQDALIKDEHAVKLMTVHASKGLEFDDVFVTGLEDGLFPLRHDERHADEREEERRLFYVALTRARKKVYLSYATTRIVFGAKQINMPSEFITDIDDALLEPLSMSESVAPRKERREAVIEIE